MLLNLKHFRHTENPARLLVESNIMPSVKLQVRKLLVWKLCPLFDCACVWELGDCHNLLASWSIFIFLFQDPGVNSLVCTVCTLRYSRDRVESLACGHAFCKECWDKYFQVQIQQGVTTGQSLSLSLSKDQKKKNYL